MKISFTGDLAFTKYFKGLYNKPDLLDSEISEFLNDSDFTVVNVEGAVFSGSGSAQKALVHSNPPEILDFLLGINGKVWNVSNNHIIDCGEEGLKHTVDFAKKNGCVAIGVGETMTEAAKPLVVRDDDGVSIGIFSVTQEETPEATENSPGCVRFDNYEKIEEIIREVKKQCRWCVINAHAGEEFNAVPLPYMRKRYRKYLELGADIVIGHHPHVVENYERVGDKIIFYSLGNFIFDTDYQRKQDYTENGVLVKIDFKPDSFSWESFGTRIDRKNQRVEKSNVPAIFTNVDDSLYKKLWPLSAKVLQLNERVKFAIIYPGKKDYTVEEWKKWEKTRNNEVGIEILKGERLSRLGGWKSAPEELVSYIKGKRL